LKHYRENKNNFNQAKFSHQSINFTCIVTNLLLIAKILLLPFGLNLWAIFRGFA